MSTSYLLGTSTVTRHPCDLSFVNRPTRAKRGAEVTAIFYTLFESAKLCGVEPKRHVLEAALRAIRNPGTATLPQDLIV